MLKVFLLVIAVNHAFGSVLPAIKIAADAGSSVLEKVSDTASSLQSAASVSTGININNPSVNQGEYSQGGQFLQTREGVQAGQYSQAIVYPSGVQETHYPQEGYHYPDEYHHEDPHYPYNYEHHSKDCNIFQPSCLTHKVEKGLLGPLLHE